MPQTSSEAAAKPGVFRRADKTYALSHASIFDSASKAGLVFWQTLHAGGGRGSSASSRIGFWQPGQVGTGKTTDATFGGV